MRLTRDPRRNVAYIRLREPAGPVETVCVSDELNVDLAPDGTIYGIELLNANEQLRADGGRIVVVDEAGEERVARPPPNVKPGARVEKGDVVQHDIGRAA